MNENRLSRVVFNNKSTQRGLAFAWRQSRTRKRSRCRGSGGGLGTDTALVFWDMGNCRILRCIASSSSVQRGRLRCLGPAEILRGRSRFSEVSDSQSLSPSLTYFTTIISA
jgi:hypothetical protein